MFADQSAASDQSKMALQILRISKNVKNPDEMINSQTGSGQNRAENGIG